MSIKQLLFDDLAEIVIPGDVLVDPRNSQVEVPIDPRFQIAKRMDVFVTKAGRVYSHSQYYMHSMVNLADSLTSPTLSSCGPLA